MDDKEKEIRENKAEKDDQQVEIPAVLDEIRIEELAVDGICGIY